jgi:hypothetical protein
MLTLSLELPLFSRARLIEQLSGRSRSQGQRAGGQHEDGHATKLHARNYNPYAAARLRPRKTPHRDVHDGLVRQQRSYSSAARNLFRAMEEIAWVLRSDPKKNEIGFVKRTGMTRRKRFVLDDDEFELT